MAKPGKTDLQLLTDAQARITELEGELATAAEQNSAVGAEHVAAVARAVAAETKVTELTAAHGIAIAAKDKTISELAAEKTKLEADAKSADERAREIAARNGGNLPAKQPGLGDPISGSDKVMPRADFTALNDAARSAFCKAGGKLTD